MIPGTSLRGTTPNNDATITITAVSNETAGNITGITVSGTASQPTGPYNAVSGANIANTGTNATFTIRRNFSTYDNIACLLYTSPSPRDRG